jgi:hypothetical protein
MPEREDRRSKQQSKITGFKIEGVREPSHALIDLVHTMQEDNVAKYLAPEVCTHREAELGGTKKEQIVQIEPNGTLKAVHRSMPQETDVSSSYKLRLAFQRRALAMDQFSLMSFDVAEAYHEYLFDLMHKVVPANFNSISLAQIVAADKLVWTYMSTNCRNGITKDQLGDLPMEKALQAALKDPIITASLQPLPKPSSSGVVRNQFERQANVRSAPYQASSGSPKGAKGGKGKGKNKSKGKGKGTTRMPYELIGTSSKTKEGQNICYNFNLNNCRDAKTGEACRRGLHVCSGCQGRDHCYASCPNKS